MRKFLFAAAITILFLVRYAWYEKAHVSHIPAGWFGKTMVVTGIVTGDPDRGIDSTNVTLGNEQLIATIPSGIAVAYGDKVEIYGRVQKPEAFMTDTNREFDYPAYLAVHDIYGTVRGSDLRIVGAGYGNPVAMRLFSIKRFFVDTIKGLFFRNEAGLFAGIVIGEKSLLPKDVLSDFQIAGLTHMVVLSGYNITVVALFVITLLAWFGVGYRGRRIGAIAIIPFFLVMTGMGASSVRAGIMSMTVFFLQITTRPAHSFRIIVYTAIAMAFANPRILLHDPSFHMSFLAFIGLVYLMPIIEKWFERFGEWYGIKDLVVETLSVQLFVLPYILWMSGRFSLLLLVSNILTVPLVPLVMGTGFFATMVGMPSYAIGRLAAVPVGWCLSYMIYVAHVVASVTALIVNVPPFPFWVMILAYAILIAVITNYHS